MHAGVALLEGVTDLVKVKALIKAASKGIKEVIRKQHNNIGIVTGKQIGRAHV